MRFTWISDGLNGRSIRSTIRLYLISAAFLAPFAAAAGIVGGATTVFALAPWMVALVAIASLALGNPQWLANDRSADSRPAGSLGIVDRVRNAFTVRDAFAQSQSGIEDLIAQIEAGQLAISSKLDKVLQECTAVRAELSRSRHSGEALGSVSMAGFERLMATWLADASSNLAQSARAHETDVVRIIEEAIVDLRRVAEETQKRAADSYGDAVRNMAAMFTEQRRDPSSEACEYDWRSSPRSAVSHLALPVESVPNLYRQLALSLEARYLSYVDRSRGDVDVPRQLRLLLEREGAFVVIFDDVKSPEPLGFEAEAASSTSRVKVVTVTDLMAEAGSRGIPAKERPLFVWRVLGRRRV